MSTAVVAVLRGAVVTLDAAIATDWPNASITPEAKLWILGQVWSESRFGSTPDWGDSNNWGAVVYHKGDGKFLQHADADAQGHPTRPKFQAYDTQLDAARDYLKVIMRGAVPKALAGTAIRAYCGALYANGYFTGTSGNADDRISAYVAMVAGGAQYVAGVLSVAALQDSLRAEGFDPGPTDGVRGPKTIAALKAQASTRETDPELPVVPDSTPDEVTSLNAIPPDEPPDAA